MVVLLYLFILIAATLLLTLLETWFDKRLIRNTLRKYDGKVESIKRQWFSDYPVASQRRTYIVIYRTAAGEMRNDACQVFGIILWRQMVWINPLADFRLIPDGKKTKVM